MIFENAIIITMDPARRVIMEGAVSVEGKKILAVGKSGEIVERFPEKRRIDC
jgi:cytosine/adenosine deaminase-related metal-dependent hydrolase